jgi:hypothetical protein
MPLHTTASIIKTFGIPGAIGLHMVAALLIIASRRIRHAGGRHAVSDCRLLALVYVGLLQLCLAIAWDFWLALSTWGFMADNTPVEKLSAHERFQLFTLAPLGFLALGAVVWWLAGVPWWLSPAASFAACAATVIVVGALDHPIALPFPLVVWLWLPIELGRIGAVSDAGERGQRRFLTRARRSSSA